MCTLSCKSLGVGTAKCSGSGLAPRPFLGGRGSHSHNDAQKLTQVARMRRTSIRQVHLKACNNWHQSPLSAHHAVSRVALTVSGETVPRVPTSAGVGQQSRAGVNEPSPKGSRERSQSSGSPLAAGPAPLARSQTVSGRGRGQPESPQGLPSPMGQRGPAAQWPPHQTHRYGRLQSPLHPPSLICFVGVFASCVGQGPQRFR